jgi:hypothetical protein
VRLHTSEARIALPDAPEPGTPTCFRGSPRATHHADDRCSPAGGGYRTGKGVQRRPKKLLTVTRVEVFGSYLDPAVDRLGDLDLAFSVARRGSGGERYVEQVLAYARDSGRSFRAYHEQLLWPQRELILTLRNRSSAISLTGQDIREITDRVQTVYNAEKDPAALPWVKGADPRT